MGNCQKSVYGGVYCLSSESVDKGGVRVDCWCSGGVESESVNRGGVQLLLGFLIIF